MGAVILGTKPRHLHPNLGISSARAYRSIGTDGSVERVREVSLC